MPRPDRAETFIDDEHLTSVCVSVAYIEPKLKTERPRKTKFGTEVATCCNPNSVPSPRFVKPSPSLFEIRIHLSSPSTIKV